MKDANTRMPIEAKKKFGENRIGCLRKPERHERNRELQTKPILMKHQTNTSGIHQKAREP